MLVQTPPVEFARQIVGVRKPRGQRASRVQLDEKCGHGRRDRVYSSTGNWRGNPFASFAVFDDDVNPTTRTGWTIGVDNATTKDFRITANVSSVSNVQQTALYINGSTSNIGIGTDVTSYAKLSVEGDILMGNILEFGGVTTVINELETVGRAISDTRFSRKSERGRRTRPSYSCSRGTIRAIRT